MRTAEPLGDMGKVHWPAVFVVELIAWLVGGAAVVFLLVALLHPERF